MTQYSGMWEDVEEFAAMLVIQPAESGRQERGSDPEPESAEESFLYDGIEAITMCYHRQ